MLSLKQTQSVSENTQQGVLCAVLREDMSAAGHTLKLILGFVTATLKVTFHLQKADSGSVFPITVFK